MTCSKKHVTLKGRGLKLKSNGGPHEKPVPQKKDSAMMYRSETAHFYLGKVWDKG